MSEPFDSKNTEEILEGLQKPIWEVKGERPMTEREDGKNPAREKVIVNKPLEQYTIEELRAWFPKQCQKGIEEGMCYLLYYIKNCQGRVPEPVKVELDIDINKHIFLKEPVKLEPEGKGECEIDKTIEIFIRNLLCHEIKNCSDGNGERYPKCKCHPRRLNCFHADSLRNEIQQLIQSEVIKEVSKERGRIIEIIENKIEDLEVIESGGMLCIQKSRVMAIISNLLERG